jgi:hypothetical protein
MELEAEIAALEATLTAPPHDGPKRLPPGPPATR